MRWWQWIAKSLPGISFGSGSTERWEENVAFAHGDLVLPANRAVLETPYLQHPVVAAACNTLAEDAASIQWDAYPVDSAGEMGDEPLDGHPLLAFLDRANPRLPGSRLWLASYLHLLLHGEFFWDVAVVTIPRPAAPPELWRLNAGGGLALLDPRRVQHKVDDDGSLSWRLDLGLGRFRPLDADRLFHHRRINPYDDLRGLSIITQVALEVEADYAATNWNRQFFGERNGMPTGMLKPSAGSNLTKEQRDELMRVWNQSHGAGRRAIGLLPPAWDFLDCTVTQKDMDFRVLRDYSRELILSVFGVPPFIAGVLDKANYANARKQEEQYWQGAIKRLVDGVALALNADLLPKLGVRGVALAPRWEVVNALVEDYDAKTLIADRLWRMGVPLTVLNQRLELGLDLDDVPGADEPHLPASPLFAADQLGADDTPEPGRNGERSKAVSRDFYRVAAARTRDLEALYERAIRRHFHELEREVLAKLAGPAGFAATRAKAAVDLSLWQWIDRATANERLWRITRSIYQQAVRRGGASAFVDATRGQKAAGVEADGFNVDAPAVQALLGKAGQRIRQINGTVQQELQNRFAAAVEDELLSEDQLRNVVRSVFATSLGRARVIARTEVGAAFEGARYEGYHQAGVSEHIWASAGDDDVRDSHRIDGERVAIGAPFSNGLLHPCDVSGPPAETINCRCVTEPVLEGD